ncbi:cation-translocating P-type ATPase [Evansella sp. AB-P1]|uniref:heavy metal translocating P-type ATPase n=1 Tax=Evansella sp. AB-P1 TaxID=3037653 RepID=UPI00241D15D1|nr:cation-translocating P-type ATPase [Evansella sp. AB-P1]MDG5789378.1 cation-translocating P-type ATPase [Evansella sp. AB-P1]
MTKWIHQQTTKLTFISGVLLIVAFMSYLIGNTTFQTGALLLATVAAGVPISIKAFQALRMKTFSIDLLVTIAVIAALYIGEYVESAVVTFLFLFGAYLEKRTLNKTRSSIKELIDMAPQEAEVLREGKTKIVSVEEVEKGDHIIVRSGGKIPVDGSILSGKATLNEAAVTGESVPAMKKVKDKLFSGTIVDNGYIEMVAEKVGDDTTFSKIIELVEEAQEAKSKTQKFLDKFANIYTPSIAGISFLVYLITRDLHLAVIFLVIACPGALVIGAPVSNVAGIGNGAKKGVLIKGGDVMERFSKVDTVVFDKTGTLTKGQPEVTDVHSFMNIDPNELLRLAAEVETISEHHLGQTIVKEAVNRKLPLAKNLENGEVIKGNGIRATVDGKTIAIGNRALLEKEGIHLSTEVREYAIAREKEGCTAVFTAIDGMVAGIISISDQIREDAYEALAELRDNGIKKLIMLTGDNRHTAELVATQLGLDEFHAELLPEDKAAFVKNLQNRGHKVAMAGDGINDAPAIASAEIGLAMGEGGTDISMETADVVLMADRLKQFSHAFALSKATTVNMKQNMFFAVGTVVILLIGVLMGNVHLASGMLIHEASVLLVILNAMRLIRFKIEKGLKKRNLQPAPVAG